MCKAKVMEQGSVYYPGPTQHCHPPVMGATEIAKVKSVIRERAKAEPFKSGAHIAEEAMRQHIEPEAPYVALPQSTVLAQAANRLR